MNNNSRNVPGTVFRIFRERSGNYYSPHKIFPANPHQRAAHFEAMILISYSYDTNFIAV